MDPRNISKYLTAMERGYLLARMDSIKHDIRQIKKALTESRDYENDFKKLEKSIENDQIFKNNDEELN